MEDDEDLLAEHFLTDELDHLILQHRDAHFAGDFKVMYHFYEQEPLRGHPDIELERIEYLARIEAELNRDLSDSLLSEQEKDEVQAALKSYEALKEIYLEDEKPENKIARLIADLILTESDEAQAEIEKIVEEGKIMVAPLTKIITSSEAYSPLFPGYGHSPYHAAICLGKIGDAKAITPLFEQLDQETFFDEQAILEALRMIGAPAKNYLLQAMRSRPITKENIHAAYALTLFTDDLEVATAAFEQLQSEGVTRNTLFTTYLIFNIEALKGSALQDSFLAWLRGAELSPAAREELELIVASWKKVS